MASEKLFERVPPHPDDLPTADMSVIPLSALNTGDEACAKKLLKACQEIGFFTVDLHGDSLGETMIPEIDELFGVMEKVMNLSEDVKAQYLISPPKSFFGFKPCGITKTETNEGDRLEFYNIGQDGLLGLSPLHPVPDVVQTHRALCTSFLRHGQAVLSAINETLARQLSLPPLTFTSFQPLDKSSNTVLRFIKANAITDPHEARTNFISHTDFGCITLLANIVGGLQVLAPGKKTTDKDPWLWVRPRPGHLIINLGDAMPQWTGGRLKSNEHQINIAPGNQRFVDRYTLGILVRPDKTVSMKNVFTEDKQRMRYEDLNAWEFEIEKARQLATSPETLNIARNPTVDVQS